MQHKHPDKVDTALAAPVGLLRSRHGRMYDVPVSDEDLTNLHINKEDVKFCSKHVQFVLLSFKRKQMADIGCVTA